MNEAAACRSVSAGEGTLSPDGDPVKITTHHDFRSGSSDTPCMRTDRRFRRMAVTAARATPGDGLALGADHRWLRRRFGRGYGFEPSLHVASSAMQPDADGVRRDPQHHRDLSRRKLFPGSERQDLTIDGR